MYAGPGGIPANTVADALIGVGARSVLEEAGIEVHWRKDVRQWWRLLNAYEQAAAAIGTVLPDSACGGCAGGCPTNDATGSRPAPRGHTIPTGDECLRSTNPTGQDRPEPVQSKGLRIGIASALLVAAGYWFFQGKIEQKGGAK